MAKKKSETPAVEQELDKSFPASLRRIAASLLATTVWDNINAAKALTAEADLLDPTKDGTTGNAD